VLEYAPGSPERRRWWPGWTTLASDPLDLPHTIGAGPSRQGKPLDVVQPHARRSVLGTLRNATTDDARPRSTPPCGRTGWRELPFDERAAVFLKAADCSSGPWRQTLNAATRLGRARTAFQRRFDAACELSTSGGFNVHFGAVPREQRGEHRGVGNRSDHRPLEGFVYAINARFNFTAIA
jgi:1-pyrroline-5-carboxylate dehydrogenase